MFRVSRRNDPLRAVALGLAALGIASSAEARTWVVHPDGSGDAPTLQAAADSSSPGDTVFAASGVHQGPVTLAFDTFLVGEGAGSSTVVGSSVDPNVVLALGGGISDLSLVGVEPAYGHVGGGALSMAGDIEVADCAFSGGDLAIDGGGDGASITGCAFDGVAVWQTLGPGGVEIVDCEFRDVRAWNASVVTFLAPGSGGITATVSGCRFFSCRGEGPVVGWNQAAEAFGPVNVEVVGNLFDECLSSAIGATSITIVDRNRSTGGRGTHAILIEGNTIARSLAKGLGGDFPAGTQIVGNAVTGCTAGVDLRDSVGIVVSCNNVWGNAAGNWIDGPDLTGVNGNLSVSPFYCAAAADNYTLAANSPMLPANNDCGIQIGAFGQGCGPVSVEPASWGGIKALYRGR